MRVFVNLIQFVNLTHARVSSAEHDRAGSNSGCALFSNGVLAEKDVLIGSACSQIAGRKKISTAKSTYNSFYTIIDRITNEV